MIATLLMIALILFLALQLEEKFKIPSPLGLISLSFVSHLLFQNLPVLTGDTEDFAALVIFLLPILLIADSLEMKLSDLKAHGFSLLYLAGVSVVLSVLMALFMADWLFASYALSHAAVIVLFAMVLATDPVSVVSIFSRFELPHRLKIMAEGESLLNDASALIIFMFVGLYMLSGSVITTSYVIKVSSSVIFGSIAIGMMVGLIGLFIMKSTQNRIAEMMVLVITGYGAYEISEHFTHILHWVGIHSELRMSGILSVIVATITVNHVMTSAMDEEERQIHQDEVALQQEAKSQNASLKVIDNVLDHLKSTIEERERHLRTKEDVQLLALVANTILFIAMAEMIDVVLLFKYKFEILVMFLATTVIRGVMMAIFAMMSNRSKLQPRIGFRWWSVLTFAGIKGGISIVMLTMIPKNFEHLEMFKAVVIGVILLSTFAYSALLLFIISIKQARFSQEARADLDTLK